MDTITIGINDFLAQFDGLLDIHTYAAIGLTAGFFLFIGILLTGVLGRKFSGWHLVGLGVFSVAGTVIAQHYANLITWLIYGFKLNDIGATVFLIGFVAFVCVLGYNAVMTKGERLVR